MQISVPDYVVAVTDAVQAICRDTRIRMPFSRGLQVELLMGDLTGTVTVENRKDWGPGTHLILSLMHSGTGWFVIGPAGLRFGSGPEIPLDRQGRKLEFDVVPVYSNTLKGRLWRPARYSVRNMRLRGRGHGDARA